MGMRPPRNSHDCDYGFTSKPDEYDKIIKKLESKNKELKTQLEKSIEYVAQSGMLHLTEFCDHCIGSVVDCDANNCEKTFKQWLKMSNEKDNQVEYVKISVDDLKFLMSFFDKQLKVRKGLDPTMYITSSYEGDLDIQKRLLNIFKLVLIKNKSHEE